MANTEAGSSTLALSKTEEMSLERLKTVVRTGLAQFYEVGEALRQIRDGRLYRATHDSFEAFCDDEFGLSRTRAYQVMEAEAVGRSAAGGNGHPNTAPKKFGAPDSSIPPAPQTEAQARALKDVPPEKRPGVWKEAVESAPHGSNGKPKVTAAHVRRVAHEQAVPERAEQRGRVEGTYANTAAGQAPPEQPAPAPPFAEFNAGIDRIVGHLSDAAAEMRKVYGAAGQEFTSPYAQKSFTFLTTIYDVNRLIRDQKDGRVVSEEPGGKIVTERDTRRASA